MSKFDQLSAEILKRIKPYHFEKIIRELIVKVPDIHHLRKKGNHIDIAKAMNSSKYLLSITNKETGTFEIVNEAWEDFSGKTFSFLTSRPFIDMVDPQDKARTIDAWNGILDDEIEQAKGFINHYFGKKIKWMPYPSETDSKYVIAVAEILQT